MNDRGEIVGDRFLGQGFVWSDGSATDLPTLGGRESFPAAINDRGWIAGVTDTAAGAFRAVLYHDGAITELGSLGGGYGAARDVNEHAQVVGESLTASGVVHAFLWQKAR
jgi:probable HAF family extracellular repeat protein